jgi:hypothetical protein
MRIVPCIEGGGAERTKLMELVHVKSMRSKI